MRVLLMAVLLALVGYDPAQAHTPTKPVALDTGLVTGLEHEGVEFFKGIPYAAPPVGSLRWRAPQPAAPWQGVRAATAFGKSCPQSLRPEKPLKLEDVSEDCLTLNVWRPVGASRLPVMVWIHGGGLTEGSSAFTSSDGTAFARGGVMLVAINYRLGRLGLFAHPALTKENADGGRLANYGLMDQIAALAWVKRNIAAFGGDPNNVTIFGESAGGASVDTLMISPLALGLFHAAISQSGYGRGAFQRVSTISSEGVRSGETEGVMFAESLGLKGDDLAGLRAVPAQKIAEMPIASEKLYHFMLDGKVITRDMWDVFRSNEEAPVPFMIGSKIGRAHV